ncbi:MAG: putative ATPase [Candidatus Azotimanducaceae bacterium]|jgi:predicted ATPase
MNTPDSQKGSFGVRFALKRATPKANEIVIYPSEKNWNDFGHQIHCEFEALAHDNDVAFTGNLFVAFLPSSAESKLIKQASGYGAYSLKGLLLKTGKTSCEPGDLPQYFTMLPDLAGYRAAVSTFGIQGIDGFLRSINDLVVNRTGKFSWFDEAVSTEVFRRGFMRNSEPFFAYHNAESILSGAENEDFSSISKSVDLSFSLEGFSNRHDVKFRFGSDKIVPRRINVLIGKNGLGKSQVLRAFCRAALGYKDPSVEYRDPDIDTSRPMISRVLAVATPGETANTFPRVQAKTQKLYYRRLKLIRNGRSGRSDSIGASLVQLARKAETIGGKSRWQIFLVSLSKIMPVDTIIVPTSSGSNVPLLTLREDNSEQALLDRWADVEQGHDPQIRMGEGTYPLSSGQLTFFKFALLCSLHIENGSFVLMDEPETHMHPNMISDFVDLLDNLLELTGSQAIIATHSAYFVREVPKQQVHVFQQDEHKAVSIDQPRLSTFGATIDSISQFVFNEDVEVRMTDKVFENAKKLGLKYTQLEEQISSEISLAALMDLKRQFELES